MTSALSCYGSALRHAAAGRSADMVLIDPSGLRAPEQRSVARWRDLHAGDTGVLTRCQGPTLDIGCGPGRLTAALAMTRIPALGIDISPEAVRQTRRRGAPAQLACVLTSELHPRRWQHLLLIDGNIGIGGDPDRLLRRCRSLLLAGGDILVELEPPSTGTWSGMVQLDYDGQVSTPFPWARVAADDVASLARQASLRVIESWTEAHRWFARLAS